MLGTRQRDASLVGLVDWAGRDRASKVVGAAATIAHGWNRLDARELQRLGEALEDHTRSYAEWLGTMNGPEVQELRSVLGEIRAANRRMRVTNDAVSRRELAGALGRGATDLVDRINAASILIELT